MKGPRTREASLCANPSPYNAVLSKEMPTVVAYRKNANMQTARLRYEDIRRKRKEE
jgi:hypothetical protein